MLPDPVHVLGLGTLRDAVLEHIERALAPHRPRWPRWPGDLASLPSLPPGALVVAIHDDSQLERDIAIQRDARARGAALLPVWLDGPLGIVGPLVDPTASGCIACAVARRRAVARLPVVDLQRGARGAGSAAVSPGEPGFTMQCSAEHTPVFVDAVATIAAAVLPSWRSLAGRVFVLQAASLTGQWHDFLPVPSCPECATIRDDSADQAWVAPDAARSVTPAVATGFRERPLPASDTLRRHLLDWRHGVVPHVFRVQGNTPLAMCGAEFTIRGGRPRDAGWGRALTYARAETIAFFEALERYACLEPRNRRLVVRSSLAALGDEALDPRCLGTRDPGPASRRPTGTTDFSDDLEVTWVWGYSLVRGRPILVPAQCVYYGALPGESNRFVRESSNGAASGTSLAEAALHGIFELIERDAFLLAWYGQLPVREIEVASARASEIGFLLDHADAHGYEVHLFDVTMDVAVTAVWGLAVSRAENQPRSFSAAGAHPDPEQAVLGALREVVPDALLYERKPEHDDAALRAMLADPYRVRSLDDHVALYTLAEAFERLSFLFGPSRVSLADLAPGWQERWLRPTVATSLAAVLDHLAAHDLDVICVDITAPEQLALGQRSVKVLIPGLLPMTFGAAERRTHGLPRLLDVPVKLGYWPRPRRYEEFAFHPHPFP